MKKILALALALCLVFALAAAASADWAPNGPVSIIVSYKAGSGTDNTARILAKYAEKYVGQTLVIENILDDAIKKGSIKVLEPHLFKN